MIRDAVLAEMRSEHMEVAEAAGGSPARVPFHHVAPNIAALAGFIATT